MIEIVPLELQHAAVRLEALAELKHDPFSRYIADNIKLRENNQHWLEHAQASNSSGSLTRYYAVFCTESELFAGEIGVDEIDAETASANVFYWIRPSLRNRGIAHQAIELLKKEKSFRSIRCLRFMVDKSNFLSERVLRKVGAVADEVNGVDDKRRNFYYVEL